MKYKEIVDLIKDISEGHVLVETFGYGSISDINTPNESDTLINNRGPLYPYVFLNPVSISQNERTATFSANLIVMTQTYDEGYVDYVRDEELKMQSEMIDILIDIISNINMNLTNPQVEFITPFTITPFKERFSDSVVGGTANISITYPSPLDDCRTPINPPPL